MLQPRVVTAANPGPFTLDGTRTHIVGRRSVAVIDPGPNSEDHVSAVRSILADATDVTVLVTHDHADHSGAARALAASLDAPVLGSTGHADRHLVEGDSVHTDDGALVTVETPGHSADHVAFHWPRADALFAGDLLLGEGDTTWVGEYSGCVRAYLSSLDRIDELGLSVIYPAHGPPLRDVHGTLLAYREHRRARIEQVRRLLSEHPGASVADLVEAIYGERLPVGLREAAGASVSAMVDHLGGVADGLDAGGH